MALSDPQKDDLAWQMKDYDHRSRIMDQINHVENKNRFKSVTRLINQNRLDLAVSNDTELAASNRRAHDRMCSKEEKLAQELVKMKNEEFCRMKNRQLLRENSHELKALEEKLRTAYVSKALAAQIAEKEAEKVNLKIREKQAHEQMNAQYTQLTDLAKIDAEKLLQKKLQYKKELQDQMILNEKTKRYEYEEFLKQKKLLDDVVLRIHDENERSLAEKVCNKIKSNQEMLAFKAAQQIWKEKEIKALDEENRKIQEYIQSKTSDAATRKAEKERMEAIKAKLSEQIARNIANEKAKAKEREDIMLELLEEEEREAMLEQHKKEMEAAFRRRLEIRSALDRQMEERKERLVKEAEEDMKYKEHLLAKLAEDEKLDQYSAANKRLKVIQMRKDIQEMMFERRKKRAESIQFLIRTMEEEEKEHQAKQRVIEEERIRMLQEHAHNLVGYIPRGVLREDDLQHLGSEFVQKCNTNKTD